MVHSLDNSYLNEELNIGKLLVLRGTHKLKISDIKSYTKAKKIKELKITDLDDIDRFLWEVMYSGLCLLKDENTIYIRMYYVEGEAASEMLRLRYDDVLASVNWNAKIIKKLHNACATTNAIKRAKYSLDAFKDFHENASRILEKQKNPNSLKRKSKAIEKITNNYGDKELKTALTIIESALKSTW